MFRNFKMGCCCSCCSCCWCSLSQNKNRASISKYKLELEQIKRKYNVDRNIPTGFKIIPTVKPTRFDSSTSNFIPITAYLVKIHYLSLDNFI